MRAVEEVEFFQNALFAIAGGRVPFSSVRELEAPPARLGLDNRGRTGPLGAAVHWLGADDAELGPGVRVEEVAQLVREVTLWVMVLFSSRGAGSLV